MKKIILLLLSLLIVLTSSSVFAADSNQIIDTQEKSLGISDFIGEAQKYTSNSLGNVDITSLYKDALTGNINASGITSGIFKILRK